jgi:hypothetical protein
MTTQEISYTVPSPGWVGTVDVTNAELDSDLSVEDYKIYYNDALQGTVESNLWEKTTQVLLTYSGSALTTGNVVKIRRNTPLTPVREVAPLETVSSTLWNAEFERVSKRDEEFREFGLPTTTIDPSSISDTAYSSGWDGVTAVAPSKNAVYDKVETLVSDTAYAAGWDGVTGTAPSKNAVYDKIETLVSDTAYAASWNGVTTVAPSKNAVYDYVSNIAVPIGLCSGRLSTTTGLPVQNAYTSSADVFFIPYMGNTVYLHTGAAWQYYTFNTEISANVGALADGVVHDIFLYYTGSALALEFVAWSSATARATALTYQQGVVVKNGDTTRRYLGSCVPNAGFVKTGCRTVGAGTTFQHDSTLWNYYNQVDGWCTYSEVGTSNTLDNDFDPASGVFRTLNPFLGMEHTSFHASASGNCTTGNVLWTWSLQNNAASIIYQSTAAGSTGGTEYVSAYINYKMTNFGYLLMDLSGVSGAAIANTNVTAQVRFKF